MELALEKRQVKSCLSVLRQRIRCEAIQETIVPDAYEDIALIAGTSGDVIIESRDVSRGRLSVMGKAVVRVLYVSDTGNLRSLSLWIPFRADIDNSRIPDGGSLRLRPWLEGFTVRELNPRKILVRVNIAADAEVFENTQAEICVSAGEIEGLFVKTGSAQMEPVLSIDEREVTVSDRLEIPSGLPPIKELMRTKVDLVPGESKAVGGKIIFKGGARIWVSYLSDDGTPAMVSLELPFSQIIDTSAQDAAVCSVNMYLSEMEIAPVSDREGRSLDVNLVVMIQTLCSGREEITFVEDMFSSRGDVFCTREEISVECLGEKIKKTKSVREVVDTGAPVTSVADIIVTMQEPVRSGQELTSDAEITLIYLDDQGRVGSAKRTVKVSVPAEQTTEDIVFSASAVGEIRAIPAVGGAEVRFDAEMFGESREEGTFSAVTSASLSEGIADSGVGAVLRRTGGESLWEICKSYRANPEMVAQINALDGGELPRDTFLLIPMEG